MMIGARLLGVIDTLCMVINRAKKWIANGHGLWLFFTLFIDAL